MKKTLSINEFREEFGDYGRGDQFSYEGLEALYEELMEFEEASGEEMELDVIAICCEFTEYDDIEEFRSNYGEEFETIDDVCERTMVIQIPNSDGFIIQDF